MVQSQDYLAQSFRGEINGAAPAQCRGGSSTTSTVSHPEWYARRGGLSFRIMLVVSCQTQVKARRAAAYAPLRRVSPLPRFEHKALVARVRWQTKRGRSGRSLPAVRRVPFPWLGGAAAQGVRLRPAPTGISRSRGHWLSTRPALDLVGCLPTPFLVRVVDSERAGVVGGQWREQVLKMAQLVAGAELRFAAMRATGAYEMERPPVRATEPSFPSRAPGDPEDVRGHEERQGCGVERELAATLDYEAGLLHRRPRVARRMKATGHSRPEERVRDGLHPTEARRSGAHVLIETQLASGADHTKQLAKHSVRLADAAARGGALQRPAPWPAG